MLEKFRVISDLHIDINKKYPLDLQEKDVFAVICGDLCGDPELASAWIRDNIKHGVFVSGNHLPYNDSMNTIQEQRDYLAKQFPADGDVTYLDAECGVFSKEVDGILFVGTCMYSDMKIACQYNEEGDQAENMQRSARKMNDFRWGIKEKNYIYGTDNTPKYVRVSPKDYVDWFENAYSKIDKLLSENEAEEHPKPVVLITHFPLIKDLLKWSYYADPDNWGSYGSDYEDWILSHQSIKCYCCGHAHMVDEKHRDYVLKRKDGTECRVISNTRGYVGRAHDRLFNPNFFVKTSDWTTESLPERPEETERKKKQEAEYLAMSAFLW